MSQTCAGHFTQQVAYNQIFMSNTLAETETEQIFLETNTITLKFSHEI